jgi:hypothetical protein
VAWGRESVQNVKTKTAYYYTSQRLLTRFHNLGWLAKSQTVILGVADLRYERLNMPVIETSIDKAWGFLTYFFHTLIKQRLILDYL